MSYPETFRESATISAPPLEVPGVSTLADRPFSNISAVVLSLPKSIFETISFIVGDSTLAISKKAVSGAIPVIV